MTLHWFVPPRPSGESLHDKLERLRPLGVRWKTWNGEQPSATYQMRDGMLVKDIGEIDVRVDTGLIEIWPWAGISYDEMVILAGCAQEAFEHKPSAATGWKRDRRQKRNRWWADIVVRADERQDLVAQRIAAHLDQIFDDGPNLGVIQQITDPARP